MRRKRRGRRSPRAHPLPTGKRSQTLRRGRPRGALPGGSAYTRAKATNSGSGTIPAPTLSQPRQDATLGPTRPASTPPGPSQPAGAGNPGGSSGRERPPRPSAQLPPPPPSLASPESGKVEERKDRGGTHLAEAARRPEIERPSSRGGRNSTAPPAPPPLP